MNWLGVVLPWIDGLGTGIPLITATVGFDPDQAVCRPLMYFVSPAAEKVGVKYFAVNLQIQIKFI